jgi:hypothetical protein
MAKLTLDLKDFEDLINDLEKVSDKVMEEAYPYFKSVTPISSGTARSNTSTRKLKIKADYAYADRLDNGWSRQAPNGMVDPTISFIEDEVRKQIGRID